MADRVWFVRTEEQALLATTLREMLGDLVDPDAVRERSLTEDAFDDATWRALGEMGLIGMALPADVGGSDADVTDLAVLFEELGRVVVPVPLLSTIMAAEVVRRGGSAYQHQKVLPGLASGSVIGTLAVFESAHGSAHDVSVTAEPSDLGWRISGTKRFVTDAPNADLFVVSARAPERLDLFVIDAGAPGVHVDPQPALDATRPLGTVTFDVEVSESERLAEGDPASTLQRALDLGTVLMAAEQVGGAQWCLDASVEYAKARYQFGRAIGSFQAIKHMCADMLVAVEHARSVSWHAATSFGDEAESAVAVPLAKSVCSDAFLRVAGDAIQVHGGIGFTWEHEAHLRLKRAKADSLLLGSVDAHRDRLADAIGI